MSACYFAPSLHATYPKRLSRYSRTLKADMPHAQLKSGHARVRAAGPERPREGRGRGPLHRLEADTTLVYTGCKPVPHRHTGWKPIPQAPYMPMPPIPPMPCICPPPPPGPLASSFSLISLTAASVVSNNPATDAAF
jgi:hypothetical protein